MSDYCTCATCEESRIREDPDMMGMIEQMAENLSVVTAGTVTTDNVIQALVPIDSVRGPCRKALVKELSKAVPNELLTLGSPCGEFNDKRKTKRQDWKYGHAQRRHYQ